MKPNTFSGEMEILRQQSLSEKQTHFRAQLESAQQLISQQLRNTNVCCDNGKQLHEQHLEQLRSLDLSSHGEHDVVELQRLLDQDQLRLSASTRHDILSSCLTVLEQQGSQDSATATAAHGQKEDHSVPHPAAINRTDQLVAYLTEQVRAAKSHCTIDESKTQLWLGLLQLKIKLMTVKDFRVHQQSQYPVCNAFIQRIQHEQGSITDKLMLDLDSDNKKGTTYGINRLIKSYINNNTVLHFFYHLAIIESNISLNTTLVKAEFSSTANQHVWDKACDELNLPSLKQHPVVTRDLKLLNSKRKSFPLFLKSLAIDNHIIKQSIPHFCYTVHQQLQILNPIIQRHTKSSVNMNVEYDALQTRVSGNGNNKSAHLIDYVIHNKITGFLNSHTTIPVADSSISLHTILQDEFDRVLEKANVAQFEDPAERNFAFKLIIKQFECYLSWFTYDTSEWNLMADYLQRNHFSSPVVEELLSHLLRKNAQRLSHSTSNFTYYCGTNLNESELQLQDLSRQCHQHYQQFLSLSTFSELALQTFSSSKKMELILTGWFKKQTLKITRLQQKAEKKKKDPNRNPDYVKKVRKHQYIESIIKQLNGINKDCIESIFSTQQTSDQAQSLRQRFNDLHRDFFNQDGLARLHGRRKSKIPGAIESALNSLIPFNKHKNSPNHRDFHQRPSLTSAAVPVGRAHNKSLRSSDTATPQVSASSTVSASASTSRLDAASKAESSSKTTIDPVESLVNSGPIQPTASDSKSDLTPASSTSTLSRNSNGHAASKRTLTPPPTPPASLAAPGLSLPPGMDLGQPGIESKRGQSQITCLTSIKEESKCPPPSAAALQRQPSVIPENSPARRASAMLPRPPAPPLPSSVPSSIPSTTTTAKGRRPANFLSSIVNHGGVTKLKRSSSSESKKTGSSSSAPQSLLQQIQNGRKLVRLKKVSSQASAPAESKSRAGSLFDPNNRAFASAAQHRKSESDILKERRRDINGNSDSDWDTDDSNISFD